METTRLVSSMDEEQLYNWVKLVEMWPTLQRLRREKVFVCEGKETRISVHICDRLLAVDCTPR